MSICEPIKWFLELSVQWIPQILYRNFNLMVYVELLVFCSKSYVKLND